MSVQARFYVRSVEKHAMSVSQQYASGWASPAPQITIKLAPVSGSKGDANKAWASATPSGDITLTVGNPEAAKWFESMLGKDVAITFEERPEDELN